MKLYAYAVEPKGDPHAVIINVSEDDGQAFDDRRQAEDVGREDIGDFMEVTDILTGDRWEVASAPCGSACRCAAVARPVEVGHGG